MMDIIKIDESNISSVREIMSAALDQAREAVIGCETWCIVYGGGSRGQMTRWPNGRGAVCFGGESLWGEWTDGVLVLDEDGSRYDETGRLLYDGSRDDEADDQMREHYKRKHGVDMDDEYMLDR